ncbi:MAG TPA: molybdenum cofactor guanylyltransferase [Candidatus Anaerobutyricum avicola]|nr:molybdenum cofactor guanylyltransferase [Candidatus Anaerobutyricum avicola]
MGYILEREKIDAMTESWDGLILAGGRNRRMGGRPKGELTLCRHTFTEIIRDELQKEARQIRLSYGTEKRQEYAGCDIVMDIYPGCGPMGGLHAGLSAVAEEGRDGVLAAACDMPFLRIGLYRYLLERLMEEEAKTGDLLDGAVPVTKQRRVVLTGDLMPERRIHPLAAVYRTSMREVLERKIRAGRYRLTDALAEARILYVNVSGNPQFVTMLQNINHISEYEALLSGEKEKN